MVSNRELYQTESNKSAFSYPRTLTTWHCPHSPADAAERQRQNILFIIIHAHACIRSKKRRVNVVVLFRSRRLICCFYNIPMKHSVQHIYLACKNRSALLLFDIAALYSNRSMSCAYRAHSSKPASADGQTDGHRADA